MTRSLALCLLISLAAAPVARSEAVPAKEARQVIEQQLSAFERDDAAGAYSYAAPELQAQFPDPDLFLYMVANHYPAVHRHRSVEFGPVAEKDGAVAETVIFTDGDGRVWNALYTLEKQPEGAWKISSCVLARSDQVAL